MKNRNRKLTLSLLVCLSILINTPVVLGMIQAPIIYVSGDGSGDFNCNETNAQIQINQALQCVAENPAYTTVYLKGPFTYVIADTLLIGSNTILEGDSSAKIKLVSNARWKAMKPMIKERSLGSHDITIRGFTIDGNREGNTDVQSGKDYYNILYFTSSQNIDINHMTLTNNHDDGLEMHSCTNVKYHDNRLYLLGHDGIYAINSFNVEAYNNNITCRTNSGLRAYNTNHVSFHDNTITSQGSGGAGIEIQKENNDVPMDDIKVYNNIIYRTALPGIWMFGSDSYPTSSANVHIHHNQIYDTGTRSNTKVIGGILSDGFNALIENNVIDGAYGAGIAQNNVYSPAPAGSGYVITVRNNIITNTRKSSAGGNGCGISNLIANTHSFVLQNNCFYSNTGGNYVGVQASPSDIAADPQYADRSKQDYHLKSKAGRWDGKAWANDSISSPCIDAGDPSLDYSNEPKPNGNRINIGPDGNTKYASKTELYVSTPILPTANFNTNVTSGYTPLSIQFIDSSQNTNVWKWNFGDSTNLTQKSPVHTYSAAGNYTVTLTVSNANGTDSKTVRINVLEKSKSVALPVANFSTNVADGTAPLSVQFTDLSQNATSRTWNFGDSNNSTQKSPVHTYLAAGNYTVTLTVSNANGTDSKTTTISVKAVLQNPVASFSASPITGNAPLKVTFSDKSTGTPSNWKWSFGDGTTSTAKNPTHTYSGAGKYTVGLTVSNAAGNNSVTKSSHINVAPALNTPISSFSASSTSGKAPLKVTFTDKSTGSPTSWKWSFGDGTSSTAKKPVHTYSKTGKYTVSLTAKNAKGSNTKTMSGYITVK